jgi:predicted  nucleic acid-binding Zn-ribbon protein
LAITTDTIKEQLILLAELQQVDLDIAALEKKLAGVQDQLDGFELQLAIMQDQIEGHQNQLGALQKQYRQDESDGRSIDDTIAKTQAKLNSVKTNKEYQAMLKAVEDLEHKKSDLEDQMLGALDQIESAESKFVSLNADFDDLKQEVEAKKAEINQKADKQREELNRLQQEREATWNQLPQKLQAIYQRVSRQGRGIGVAAVTDALCQVCRVNIPSQLFIDLMRMHTMIQCPNCQRIMYPCTIWDNEPEHKVRSE